MENEFYSVVSEARRYELFPNTIDALRGALTRWEKQLRKTDKEIIREFQGIHWAELTRTATVLRSIQDPSIRGSHDRIFTNIIGVQKRMPSALTILFANFIKGITYFQSQNAGGTEVPIYHRLYSCGTGDDAFRNTFQKCTPDMDKQDRNDIRTRIETCYIERLIYDELYRKLALFFPKQGTEDPSQDQKHIDRLTITKADFETCFPNLQINIEINMDINWPIELIIYRYIRGTLISTERYVRTIVFSDVLGDKKYEDAVEATRLTENHKYFRVQRFVYRPAWKKIKHRM